MKRLEKLLEPYHIGSVKTRNRIIKTGATTLYWHQDELHMNKRTLAYYEAIARGGVGLIIQEITHVDGKESKSEHVCISVHHDKMIPGLSRIAEAVKQEVNKSGKWKKPLVTQIVPAGRFYPAEDYHQQYLQKHPGGYTCHFVRE